MKWMALDECIIHDIDLSTFEEHSNHDQVTLFHNNATAEFSCTCEINHDLLREITGSDISSNNDIVGYTVFGQMPYLEQSKRHKKKRINKKWLKRYGYVTKFKTVKLENLYFKPGTNEFTCDLVKEG